MAVPNTLAMHGIGGNFDELLQENDDDVEANIDTGLDHDGHVGTVKS